jgi:signal transduction histidine kinase
VIRDPRNYIFGLRPGALADRALDAALRELVAEFEQRIGFVTVAEIDPAVASQLSRSPATSLQLAREACRTSAGTPASRPAGSRSPRTEDRAVLQIDDDGAGFDPSSAQRGEGLTNLEQRAEAAGGWPT